MCGSLKKERVGHSVLQVCGSLKKVFVGVLGGGVRNLSFSNVEVHLCFLFVSGSLENEKDEIIFLQCGSSPAVLASCVRQFGEGERQKLSFCGVEVHLMFCALCVQQFRIGER